MTSQCARRNLITFVLFGKIWRNTDRRPNAFIWCPNSKMCRGGARAMSVGDTCTLLFADNIARPCFTYSGSFWCRMYFHIHRPSPLLRAFLRAGFVFSWFGIIISLTEKDEAAALLNVAPSVVVPAWPVEKQKTKVVSENRERHFATSSLYSGSKFSVQAHSGARAGVCIATVAVGTRSSSSTPHRNALGRAAQPWSNLAGVFIMFNCNSIMSRAMIGAASASGTLLLTDGETGDWFVAIENPKVKEFETKQLTELML